MDNLCADCPFDPTIPIQSVVEVPLLLLRRTWVTATLRRVRIAVLTRSRTLILLCQDALNPAREERPRGGPVSRRLLSPTMSGGARRG